MKYRSNQHQHHAVTIHLAPRIYDRVMRLMEGKSSKEKTDVLLAHSWAMDTDEFMSIQPVKKPGQDRYHVEIELVRGKKDKN